ncbi:UNVERIFIED_CONTAM: hypothetical protein FKN15_014389 [Acipenser sinensis]
MAQGPKDQGGVGTADPDDDSPNMIVYRKVVSSMGFSASWTCRYFWRKGRGWEEKGSNRGPLGGGGGPGFRLNLDPRTGKLNRSSGGLKGFPCEAHVESLGTTRRTAPMETPVMKKRGTRAWLGKLQNDSGM